MSAVVYCFSFVCLHSLASSDILFAAFIRTKQLPPKTFLHNLLSFPLPHKFYLIPKALSLPSSQFLLPRTPAIRSTNKPSQITRETNSDHPAHRFNTQPQFFRPDSYFIDSGGGSGLTPGWRDGAALTFSPRACK